MRYIKVFVLTIDSESWLGSEIHPSREAALRSLVESSHWIEGVDESLLDDEEELRGVLGDENVFFWIEETLVDTYAMEWSN